MDFKRKLRGLRPMPGSGSGGELRTPAVDDERDRMAPLPAALDAEDEGKDARIARLRGLIGEVAERHDRRSRRSGARASEPQPVPVGELQDTPHGELHVVERWLEPDACHGRVPVAGALSVDSSLMAKLALDTELDGVDLSRMLILDTETTGLAGGTGTVPFLIGLSFFDEGVLRVEQLFLRNLGQEVPMLQRLAERIRTASCIVSYNGKSFDWPLLRSRFILNRVPAPELPPHLDLLHCSRRIFKGRLDSVRLVEMEREVLGFHREGDVDGSLIPGLYTGYLRGGDPDVLLPILEHNDMDVVALAALIAELARHFTEVQREGDPRDHLAYARVAARADDAERALHFARAAVDGGGAEAVAVDALSLIAQVQRKRGQPGEAAEALHQALPRSSDPGQLAELHFALAKLYEHGLRDWGRARHHARHTEPVEGPQAHGRRLGRLSRRLLRATARQD